MSDKSGDVGSDAAGSLQVPEARGGGGPIAAERGDSHAPQHPRIPGLAPRITIAICLAAMLLLNIFGSKLDFGVVNILDLILLFIQVVTLLFWFAFRSGYPRGARIAVPVVVIVGLVTLLAVLRFDNTSGALVPTSWRWSWAKKQDQMLKPPERLLAAERINLSSTSSADFPGFLGPDRSATVDEIELDPDWTSHPPRQLWVREVGAGWSGFAAVNGFAVTIEQRDGDEWTTCYEIETGRLVWSHAIATRHETVMGGIGPRSTPTIHEGYVYALGATGVLRCLDGSTGQLVWERDLYSEFGLDQNSSEALIAWGRSNSPLIVNDKVVVPAGGPSGMSVSLVALDRLSGETIWQAGDAQVSYSSPVLRKLAGRDQIVSVNEDCVTGHDPATGDVLWKQPFPGSSSGAANTAQPVVLADDRILLTKAYGVGAKMFRVRKDDSGRYGVELVWEHAQVLKTKFTNVSVAGPYAFGLSDGILECIDWSSGESQWKSGRYGHGQLLRVGKHLLVLSEKGVLSLVAADSSARRELATLPVLEGQTWNNLCLYGDRLLVRNAQQAACYELRQAKR